MLEGQLLPQPVVSLASVIAVTYVGTKKLPKSWLKSTFRVRRRIVYEALVWLMHNNKLYKDVAISEERLGCLPIFVAMQHKQTILDSCNSDSLDPINVEGDERVYVGK
ncbi:hypothetical protein BD769DRAFT_1475024 [Suillus cothurnatus]|nr:hypothetical protein BD769DRAFT_1475024 [Suillus cothurnatus]